MRGFVTVAVGEKKYYKLAENLLKSYKYSTNEPMPFAIIADKSNEITKLFDKVVLLKKPSCSYLDKLEMLNDPPFEENIFIDADCLIYGDINEYWKYFPKRGTTCFGKSLPLTSQDGWSKINDIGEYKEKISFIPSLHGGIIFFRNDDLTKKIYTLAFEIAEQYSQYSFRYFKNPADEPVLALSMAVNESHPIELKEDAARMFVFYPAVKKVHMDISKKKLCYLNNSNQWINNVLVLHWQNQNTQTPKYKIEIKRMNGNMSIFYYFYYYLMWYFGRIFKRVKNGLLRRIKKENVK